MGAILDLLRERGHVSLAVLASTLGASPATIRRDVAELAGQGLLVRTHGGASPLDDVTELPVSIRDGRRWEAKRAIASVVSTLLPPGRHSIAMTGGTTTGAILRALDERDDLTVITNSLSIGLAAAEMGQGRVLIVGGVLRANSLELVGSLAESTMGLVHVDTAILGADGVSIAGGLTTHDDVEARTNHLMVERATRVIAALDASKLGLQLKARMATLEEVDVLVTDEDADERTLDAVRGLGVEVHVARL